ncbi:MAG TPA: response regulator, partial [Chloroflexota bacterium]|nr:response regulator [Chloroflexota bacterium]
MKTSEITVAADKSLEAQTILIVEDDALTRELVCLVLGEAGYAVDTAPDGGDALELLQRSSPDVILLDMGLPGMGSRAFV